MKRPLSGLSSFLIWPYNYVMLFLVSIVIATYLTEFLVENHLFTIFFPLAVVSEGVLIFAFSAIGLRIWRSQGK